MFQKQERDQLFLIVFLHGVQNDVYFEEMDQNFQYGDWKLMYLLGINMDPVVLREFLREVYKSLRNKTEKTRIELVVDSPNKI